MENPSKMDDLGVPLFQEITKCIYLGRYTFQMGSSPLLCPALTCSDASM